MFPPARETLEQSLCSAAQAPKNLKRPYILGHQAVLTFDSIRRLRPNDLSRAGFENGQTLEICALGSALTEQVLSQIHLNELREIGVINGMSVTSGPAIRIVSYECLINSAQLYQLDALKNLRSGIGSSLGKERIDVAFEVPASLSRWQHYLDQLAEGLKRFVDGDQGINYILKLRCGGAETASRDQLATAIEVVCDRKLGFKATAGLHHPLVDRVLYQNEVGFISLAIAYALKHQLGKDFTHRDISTCLVESQKEAFKFKDGIGWRDFFITLDQLRAWKADTRFSIGSCSVIEPDQDLERLFGAP